MVVNFQALLRAGKNSMRLVVTAQIVVFAEIHDLTGIVKDQID